MQPRPQHDHEFPLYEGRKTFHRLYYSEYNTDGVYWRHRDLVKTFVKIPNPNYKLWYREAPYQYGYVLADELLNPSHLLISLQLQNYEFRRTPVQYTGAFKPRVRARVSSGKRAERFSNDYCDSEFPEYDLVRKKRRSSINDYLSWTYDDLDYGINEIRSWKRTKKRKQWM